MEVHRHVQVRFRLGWCGQSGTPEIDCGEHRTESEAVAAIPAALDGLLATCDSDAGRAAVRAGSWLIY